ncbi:MAG: beta-lactamase family protein [Dehalococcoidia bacterium]|nr:beta-lactamase family protein [Dehalococcoidia bacterium]
MDSELNGRVKALIARQIAEGRQIGTQVCAYRDGHLIVDAWDGQMGAHDERRVGPDSLFSSFSTTKGVAATILHMLAGRGLLDYDAPVAKYWPEFARAGKGEVTVAQAMSHQAGLHAVPRPFTIEFIEDWEGALDWIAAQAPAYPPGTNTGYHAFTYAWVVGGIIQKASGRHIKEWLAEDLAGPLGVGDSMFIGIPEGVDERLTTLKNAPPPAPGTPNPAAALGPDHPMFQAMPMRTNFTFNDARTRRACLPSANGHFNARALARMYGALANGGEIDGVRIIASECIPHMYRLMTDGTDIVLGQRLRKGIGFFLGGSEEAGASALGPSHTTFGHPGAGGSVGWADPEQRLSVAVTINQMHSGLQGEGPVAEICNFIRAEIAAR